MPQFIWSWKKYSTYLLFEALMWFQVSTETNIYLQLNLSNVYNIETFHFFFIIHISIKTCQKHVSKHNKAPNDLTMKELPMGWLDLLTKNLFSAILEFSILRGGKGKNINIKRWRMLISLYLVQCKYFKIYFKSFTPIDS